MLARAIEGWRLGFVYNLSTGNWITFGAANMQYANGVADVVNADVYKELIADAGVKWGIPTSNPFFSEGAYFDSAKWTRVTDPQCGAVSPAITQGSVRCTLLAVAKIVPANTPGAVVTGRDAAGNPTYGLIVLQNPYPGQRGNLGSAVLKGPALWRFDANLEKSFQINESKSLRLRADAFNVLNHPQPGNPNTSINLATGPLGQITTKTGGRTFQGQLRFQF